MYKFLCANITKSRNFSSSSEKLLHIKKLRDQSSSSQSTSKVIKKNCSENNNEETQELEEDNGDLESPKSSRSPTRNANSTLLYQSHSQPNLIEYSTVSASNKSAFSTFDSSRKSTFNDKVKSNYTKAMENLAKIQSEKADYQFKSLTANNHVPGGVNKVPFMKLNKKKVIGKLDITYPTHTFRHNIAVTKRFRLREGAARNYPFAMQEDIDKKKIALQKKMLRNIPTRIITYPKLVENFKNSFNRSKEAAESEKPKISVIKSEKLSEEEMDQHKSLTLDEDFEDLIKSHPTIANASNEAKMKLKNKFIHLLIKSARSSTRIKHDELLLNKENNVVEEIGTDIIDKTGNVSLLNIEEKSEENNLTEEKLDQLDTASIMSHPNSNLTDREILQKVYTRVRYPKIVWVNDTNIEPIDLEEICMKETGTKPGSHQLAGNSRDHPKEVIKVNLIEKQEKIPHPPSIKLKPMPQSSEKPKNIVETLERQKGLLDINQNLEAVKKERVKLIKKLESLEAKQEKKSFLEPLSSSAPINAVIKNNIAQQEQMKSDSSEKLRKMLTGELWIRADLVNEKPIRKIATKVDNNFSNPKIIPKKINAASKPSMYHTEKRRTSSSSDTIKDVRPKKNKKDIIQFSKYETDSTKFTKLDQPTIVDELNDEARNKAEIHKKHRKREDQRKETEERKNKASSQSSVKIQNVTPRFDKVNDRLDEKVEIGKKNKKKIEEITQGGVPETPKRKKINLNKNNSAELKSVRTKKDNNYPEQLKVDLSKPFENSETISNIIKNRRNNTLENKVNMEKSSIKIAPVKSSFITPNKLIPYALEKLLGTKIEKIDEISLDLEKSSKNVLTSDPANLNNFSNLEKPSQEIVKEQLSLQIPVKYIKNSESLLVTTPQDNDKSKNIAQVLNSVKHKEHKFEDETYHYTEGIAGLKAEINVKIDDAPSTIIESTELITEVPNKIMLAPTEKTSLYNPNDQLFVNNIKNDASVEQDVEKQVVEIATVSGKGALLRPGDEIIFLKNKPGCSMENISNALSMPGTKGGLNENALIDTKNKIDEMMKKISDLEMLLRDQNEEKKLGNKIRVPPPSPAPIPSADKSKKEINKDKPKGPKDMVLPPAAKVTKQIDVNLNNYTLKTKLSEHKVFARSTKSELYNKDQHHIDKVQKYFEQKFGLKNKLKPAKSLTEIKSNAIIHDNNTKNSNNSNINKQEKIQENKVLFDKSGNNRAISCPPSSRQNLEIEKYCMSGKTNGRAVSCPPRQLSRIGESKRKYSNYSQNSMLNKSAINQAQKINSLNNARTVSDKKDNIPSDIPKSAKLNAEEQTANSTPNIYFPKKKFQVKVPKANNIKSVIVLAELLKEKNLSEKNSLGVLNITLPKITAPVTTKVKIAGYRSERSLTNKNISTTSSLHLTDKDFCKKSPTNNNNQAEKEDEEKPLKNTIKNEKSAIFRIQYDGEVFIIKKAQDDDSLPIPRVKKDPDIENCNKLHFQNENKTKCNKAFNSTEGRSKLEAKIEKIYDKNVSYKIRENRKLKKFNQCLVKEVKSDAWKSIFNSDPKEEHQPIQTSLFGDSCNKKLNNEPDLSQELHDPALNDYLNKNCSELLKNIEKHLAERTKNMESKRDQIKKINSIRECTHKENENKMIKTNAKPKEQSAIKPEKNLKPNELQVNEEKPEEKDLYKLNNSTSASIKVLKNSEMYKITDPRTDNEEYKASNEKVPKMEKKVHHQLNSTDKLLEEIKNNRENFAENNKPGFKEEKLISEENLTNEIKCWASAVHNKVQPKLKLPSELKPEGKADKFVLSDEDNFMSVDKSIRKKLRQKPLEETADGETSDMNKIDNEKVVETVIKSKVEKSEYCQKKRSKKDLVENLNSTASEILKEQERQRQRELHNRIHNKIVSAPLQNAPWGKTAKQTSKNTEDNRKDYHSEVHREKLISKAEFLYNMKNNKSKKGLSYKTVEDVRKVQSNINQNSSIKNLADLKPVTSISTTKTKNDTQHQQIVKGSESKKIELISTKKSNLEKANLNHLSAIDVVLSGTTMLTEIIKPIFQKVTHQAESKIKPSTSSHVKTKSDQQKLKKLDFKKAAGYNRKLGPAKKSTNINTNLESTVKKSPAPNLSKVSAISQSEMIKPSVSPKSAKPDLKQIIAIPEAAAAESVKPNLTKNHAENTYPQLSTEALHFKINEMAKIITEKINLNKLEGIKKTDQVNFLQTDPIKTEIERMIELKRKNKAERRLKSSNNIQHLPKQEAIELSKIEKDKICAVPSKKPSAETLCNQIILPKKNPDIQFLSKESMCMHESTLGIPKKDNIKIVPEEMKKLFSNKVRKSQKDPLAKYRNLKITYMPIKKPIKSETESFLPDVAKEQFEGKLITIEEKDKILSFRFELLRRLNEEFQNQVLQQYKNNKTCDDFDQFSSANNVKNLISSMKLTKLEAMGKIVKEIPKEKFIKTGKLLNKPTKKPSKNNDDKKNSRSYSTDSRNFDLQKIDLCENILENMKVATIEIFEEDNDESCDETFNIEEALPKAFTCSSPDLEEERQDNLYYKYHNMSFSDIHEYLGSKRAFAAETAEKGKKQVEKNLSSIKNEKK